MCGIVGIVGQSAVNSRLYDALTVLQHRGQDAAGIATLDGERLWLRRAVGMVRDIFQEQHMKRLKGHIGIGHVRYPTAGTTTSAESQPFYVNSPYGIALGHNGNLTNADVLRRELFDEDRRHINTDSDSEVLLNVFATELQRSGARTLTDDDVFRAVARVHERCRGAYAVVAVIVGFGMVAFRDPFGIRPLIWGETRDANGREVIVASESVALDVLGFRTIGDIKPGEALIVHPDSSHTLRQCAETTRHVPCIFEHVYLARPDTILDGTSVYRTRLRMGQKLAEQVLRTWPDHDIDVVIPIPDTSRTAAHEMALLLNRPFREGFIKNRYIGRTFIMPGQKQRQKSVRQKLNPIPLEFAGRNVLLVDDSIVRGTTCRQIVEMAREAGARRVYFASAAPPVRYPNVYGIDMPAAHELIASDRDTDQVCDVIGADRLFYQTLDDLIAACVEENPRITEYETSIFTGQYITGDVTPEYLARLEAMRNDGARTKGERRTTVEIV
jgi:amidophosphoribosyltransferase